VYVRNANENMQWNASGHATQPGFLIILEIQEQANHGKPYAKERLSPYI
jgi:hypothetical protein